VQDEILGEGVNVQFYADSLTCSFLRADPKAPPPWNHLGTTSRVRWGRAESLTRRGFQRSAPTAPTYFPKSMAREGYYCMDIQEMGKGWGTGGIGKERGGGRWGHPSGIGLQAAPLLGLTRPHLRWGHPTPKQVSPAMNAQDLRKRTEMQLGETAQDLRISTRVVG
jgi:hypothetical protein